MLRDVALGIRLDHEVDEAWVLIGGDGGIGAHNFLGLSFNIRSYRYMLANGQTEDVVWSREGETVAEKRQRAS